MSNTDRHGRPKKTAKEIEAQAKAAINAVITEKKGALARGIKPELRRAFPFGPQASELEKSIWEKTVMAAEAELHRWPKPLTMLLLAVAVSSQVAVAGEVNMTPPALTMPLPPAAVTVTTLQTFRPIVFYPPAKKPRKFHFHLRRKK